MARVLVVDDEPQILRALRINLRVRGYEVDTAASGKQALETAARHPPDLVILDLGLPDLNGVEVIGGLRGWSTAPITSTPFRSGRPRSRITRSGGCRAAVSSACLPLAAVSTS